METDWLRKSLLRKTNTDFAKDQQALDALHAERLAIIRNAPTVMVMQEMSSPRDTHLLVRALTMRPAIRSKPEYRRATWSVACGCATKPTRSGEMAHRRIILSRPASS